MLCCMLLCCMLLCCMLLCCVQWRPSLPTSHTMQVVESAPNGAILADYTHGPVVGEPGVGDSAAVTFQDLWRPAAAGTGPELKLQNVTAWCGTSWEAAAPTAAAALAQSSSEPEVSHFVATPQPGSSQAGAQQTADGSSSTQDGTTEGSTRRRRWVRPLAVAGGSCALLLPCHLVSSVQFW